MKSSALKPVRFVDDGHPESSEYANNYVWAPARKRRGAHRQTTLRAVWRLLRRRAHAARQRRLLGGRAPAGVGQRLDGNLA